MPEPVRGILVGCGDAKLDESAEARDLYTSNYFQLKREYAERYGDLWYVVSAEHGLLAPDTTVEPYDTPLDAHTPSERREWMRNVAEELHDVHLENDVDSWTVLAGGDYLRVLDLITSAVRIIDSYAPTAGMQLFERMQWLSAEVDGKDGAEVLTADGGVRNEPPHKKNRPPRDELERVSGGGNASKVAEHYGVNRKIATQWLVDADLYQPDRGRAGMTGDYAKKLVEADPDEVFDS